MLLFITYATHVVIVVATHVETVVVANIVATQLLQHNCCNMHMGVF
jgi:hypothetical protein